MISVPRNGYSSGKQKQYRPLCAFSEKIVPRRETKAVRCAKSCADPPRPEFCYNSLNAEKGAQKSGNNPEHGARLRSAQIQSHHWPDRIRRNHDRETINEGRLVPEVGLEPTYLAAADFESAASTIPPLGPSCRLTNRSARARQPPRAHEFTPKRSPAVQT